MLRTCPVCGTSFQDNSKYKPKTYCSDNCANYAKYKTAIEKTLIKLNISSIEAKKQIRGDMFRLANILSKSTVTNSIKEVKK